MYDRNLDRVYGDRTYVSITTVRHEGTTVAFAMDADRRIYYSVLNLDLEERAKGPLDVAYWNAEPALLPFPGEILEIRPLNAGAPTLPPMTMTMPVVKRGGTVETIPDLLAPVDRDPFMSTTARLTAAEPIRVISEGRYILVFRQSIEAGDPSAVFQLADGTLTGDQTKITGTRATVVDGSVLCDRFVLVGSELKPVIEPRYRRSRSKFVPAPGGDTLGTTDMEGRSFYEPTLKLGFMPRMRRGAYCVTLLPTAVSGVSRWQFFAYNAATDRVESLNLPVGGDGLFSLAGKQLYTSPEPKYQASVLEREPGIDYNTKLPLIPVRPTTDRAGTALRFDATKSSYVSGPALSQPPTPTGLYTVEAWIRPTAPGGTFVCSSDQAGNGFQLGLDGQGKLVGSRIGTPWSVISNSTIPMNAYSHVAATFDGRGVNLFINGVSVGGGPSSIVPDSSWGVTVGAGRDSAGAAVGFFTGDVDEVRVWNFARSGFADRSRRLTGIEQGLAVYYRFDDGPGSTARDTTRNVRDATFSGSPTWVSSDAPIGDGPGMARDTFGITRQRLTAGLTAALYFQQEPQTGGYTIEPALHKRQARLLLAFPVADTSTSGQPPRPNIATLDFGITRHGRISQIPSQISLTTLTLPAPTPEQQKIIDAQNALAAARDELNADRALEARIPETQGMRNEADRELNRNNLVGLNQAFGGVRGSLVAYEKWLRTEIASRDAQLATMRAAQQRLGRDEATVAAAQATLATLTRVQRGGNEVVLPMPLVSTDRSGLGAYGALLGFAWTAETPSLLDSSTGDVVLYFRGADGQFFSAYYATSVSRAVKGVTVADGKLEIVARDTSAALADFSVTVSPGATPDQCQVQVTRGTVTETFAAVPRTAGTFAAVLNGSPPLGTLLGTALPPTGLTVPLTAPLTVALTAGTAISIGGVRCRLAADAASGSSTLTLIDEGRPVPGGGEVRTLVYDYVTKATSNAPGVSLESGSLIVGVRTGGATAQVSDGTAADVAPALSPRWRGGSPGRALYFDGKTNYLTLPSGLANAVSTGDLTVEAWANPAFLSERSRVVHASLRGTQTPAGSVPPVSYTMGMESAFLNSALEFNSTGDKGDYVDCGNTLSLTGTDFTIEMWVRRVLAGDRPDPLFSQGDSTNSGMSMGFREDGTIGINWGQVGVRSTDSYKDRGWHHWAVSYAVSNGQVTIYRDGAQIAQGPTGPYPVTGTTILAALWNRGAPASVDLDEVRVWGRCRSAEGVKALMNTRVSGEEPGLLAYWNFENGSAADRTGNHHDGVLKGSPTPIQSGLLGYALVAGVGDQFVRSADTFPVGQWGHVAMSFHQDWAMQLDGTDYLSAGGPQGLDLLDDLTIEAFVKLDALGRVHGLVSKGAIGSGKAGTAVPYALYIEADGQLAFAWEEGSGGAGTQKVVKSGSSRVEAGAFTKVAVIRKGADVTLHISDKSVGTSRTSAKPVGNDDGCEIGRYRVGSTTFGLRGALSEVRIWNTAREVGQLGKAVPVKATGLVAWWTFPEARGATTADRCGSYPATVHGAVRVRTPDPKGNRITLYQNGAVIKAAVVDNGDPLVKTDYGSNQLTVGGITSSSGILNEGFTGVLDEIRIWRTERTQEQILDNLFCRLRGERPDLLAYYPLDADSTIAGATVADQGLRGNNLTPSAASPGIVVSEAPISDDSPQVRSALTTVRTPFSSLIGSTPTASEYADMQRDSQGVTIGVMKRCYSYLRAGSWVLRTGFKVGDLTTTWVAQAQFAPQLIGFIEGAPPVPSENLIYGTASDYNDKSNISFVQADNVTNTLAATRAESFDISVKGNFEFNLIQRKYAVTAPGGVGTSEPVSTMKGGYKAGFELKYTNGWSNETNVSQGAATTRTSAVSLGGYWEDSDPAKQVNATAGRRWVPTNSGFAIVQSETADLYALRLAHSGALVAYRMTPNPDIPPDWNIITFKINPGYTKQGTLDGVVGFTGDNKNFADPDYPNAADGTKGEFSYYRPREAYALKRRIQREELQLQAFYDSTLTDPNTANPVTAQAQKVLNGMFGGTGAGVQSATDRDTTGSADARAASRSGSRRNLVNTYVWTASGGLFSETVSTTDQVTQTTAGNSSFYGSFTVGGQFEYELAGFFGMKGGIDVTFGGGYTQTRTKTKQSARTFSLNVNCQPNRDLQQYTGGNPQLDASGRPVLVPGRVDAYRFMSFYLDTSADNYDDFFGKVIDPQWLQSSDPGAIALRQARQADRKPPCWRIMHRVTFVSRVLPPVSSGQPSRQQAMASLNMASDHALVQRLQPYLRAVSATTTATDLATATSTALTANFPTLTAYTDDITAILAAYYGIPL
ncbi:LamG-like jellyroll fold domain-containing protein [Actinomadura oligospora]|uniref:LamG-like jellyroll fold domain-containing protein n=1 Tax=Actinomadura oligospora TaxID=111804 RepID=UPI00047EE2B5|nr:LamG-like jellyroll fold domain-containing protein [Actinomadura oligospora]